MPCASDGASESEPASASSQPCKLTDSLVLTEVTNVGQRRVVVHGWDFIVNRRPHAVLPAGLTRPLPPTLEDGDQVVTWVRSDVFARQLQAYGYRGVVKVQAWVTDTSGTTHRGDTIKLDLDDAIRTND